MGFKEIIAQGLIDGVGGFLDSIVHQIDEQSGYAVTNELLNMHEENLKKIKSLLETIGGDGKFDEFADTDELWGCAVLISSIVSGIELEDFGSKELREIRDAYYADLFDSWQQTRVFLETDICLHFVAEMQTELDFSELGTFVDSFFNDIIDLSYNKKGILAKWKLKKMIRFYSERVYAECDMYKIIIATIRNTLE